MRAMVLRGTDLAIEEVALPRPGPGQLLARVLACGICGSDLHAARHIDQMTAAAGGGSLSQAGIVMGHEFVAEVVEVGEGVNAFAPGARVTCMPVLIDPTAPGGMLAIGYNPRAAGAYGESILLSAALCLPVPEALDDATAATTEPCAVGLHAVRESRIQPGEPALVMGAGPIGLMTLLWLKEAGVRFVAISDPAPERRALARTLGADAVLDPAAGPLAAALAEALPAPEAAAGAPTGYMSGAAAAAPQPQARSQGAAAPRPSEAAATGRNSMAARGAGAEAPQQATAGRAPRAASRAPRGAKSLSGDAVARRSFPALAEPRRMSVPRKPLRSRARVA